MNTKTIEPVHIKFITRFEILIEFSKYLINILTEFNRNTPVKSQPKPEPNKNKIKHDVPSLGDYLFVEKSEYLETSKKVILQVYNLQEHYYNGATHFLSQYYIKSATADIIENYYVFLTSENIIGQMDRLYADLQKVIEEISSLATFKKIMTSKNYQLVDHLLGGGQSELKDDENPFNDNTSLIPSINKMTYNEVVSKYTQLYSDNKIELPTQMLKKQSLCVLCNIPLILFTNDAEERCLKCGYINSLVGTLFDDNQAYNQQNTFIKHKKHNPNNHCSKWLYQLQAKEVKNFPQTIIDVLNKKAIKEYSKDGKVRSMHDLKCCQIRNWLKEIKLATYNNHAPLLRKIITGLNGGAISPPQLSGEEEVRVLTDFSLAVDIFEIICRQDDVLRLFNKPVIRNKLYYPFFLLKILVHHFRGDSRLPGLIECIHLQSSVTLTKDDYLWRLICTELSEKGRPYVYEPTDRTMLISIF